MVWLALPLAPPAVALSLGQPDAVLPTNLNAIDETLCGQICRYFPALSRMENQGSFLAKWYGSFSGLEYNVNEDVLFCKDISPAELKANCKRGIF